MSYQLTRVPSEQHTILGLFILDEREGRAYARQFPFSVVITGHHHNFKVGMEFEAHLRVWREGGSNKYVMYFHPSAPPLSLRLLRLVLPSCPFLGSASPHLLCMFWCSSSGAPLVYLLGWLLFVSPTQSGD